MKSQKDTYKSIIVSYENDSFSCNYEKQKFRDLKKNEVLVKISYSTINYKDALSVVGLSKIIRTNRLVPGLDLSGVVIESNSNKFKVNDKVMASGSGLGEISNGAFSEFVYISDNRLFKIPQGLTLKSCMIIGTAGFSALLAIRKMLQNNQRVDMGPILITGSSGGVGNFTTIGLKSNGFKTICLTSKNSKTKYLKSLGADKVCQLNDFSHSKSKLDKIEFGGVIDNIGGEFINTLLKKINFSGNFVSVGMANNIEFNSSVFPFIIRGVSILGISSSNIDIKERKKIWSQVPLTFNRNKIKLIKTQEIKFSQIKSYCKKIISNKISGRVVIKF